MGRHHVFRTLCVLCSTSQSDCACSCMLNQSKLLRVFACGFHFVCRFYFEDIWKLPCWHYSKLALLVLQVLAPCCLFLAAKVEEQPRKLEHVIRVAHACLHRDGAPLDIQSEVWGLALCIPATWSWSSFGCLVIYSRFSVQPCTKAVFSWFAGVHAESTGPGWKWEYSAPDTW